MFFKHRPCLLLVLALCGIACQKVSDERTPAWENLVSVKSSSTENLGHVFSSSNVLWKMHPLNDNAPVFVPLPNSASGFNMVMIDNGKLSGATPVNAFRFVTINMYNKTTKIINVVSKTTGALVEQSLGRITRVVFGMNKKMYVATEASYGGGGRLIELDPYTETAYDLGKPFKLNGKYLDIYSLSVGKDGALYGGSFGGNGEVMTFRYDYNGNWQVDKNAIDDELRYVINVTGDSRYTYASCGKNKWKLIVIDRMTGEKRVMLSTTVAIGMLELNAHVDAIYCKMASYYKVNGFNSPQPLASYPGTERVSYIPYDCNDARLPQVNWDAVNTKLRYYYNSGEQGSITVNNIYKQTFETNIVQYSNGNVYIVGGKPSALAVYNNQKANVLGSFPFNVYCATNGLQQTNDAAKLFFSGYPKGNLYEYKVNDSWTLPGEQTTAGLSSPTATNPSTVAVMQNADGAGTFGPMSTGGVVYTKTGYIVVSGNNDRVTASGSREFSIGSVKNNVVRNFYLNEFASYEYLALSVSNDSNYAVVAAISKGKESGKLYVYDPSTNSIISSSVVAELAHPGATISNYKNNTVLITASDMVILYDLVKKQTIYKQILGSGQRITAIAKASESTFFIASMFAANVSKIQKVKVDDKQGAMSLSFSYVGQVKDEDGGESQPMSLSIVPTVQGYGTIYVAGLRSLYRVNNVLL